MKKFFTFLLVMLVFGATSSYAQATLLATLNHNDSISTFYGSSAFSNALNAASSGDIITLSSGTFAAVDITKSNLTIRGAGMDNDTINNRKPTIISGVLNLGLGTIDSKITDLTIEGIYFNDRIHMQGNMDAINFIKNRFKYVDCVRTKGYHFDNLGFVNCKIADNIDMHSSDYSSGSFNNCVIGGNSISGGHFTFNNCILNYSGEMPKYCEYQNCIIRSSTVTEGTSTYWNNLFITNTNTSIPYTNTKISPDDEKVANLVGDYSDAKDYKLNEELKSLIKGTDGTEVGIYGGLMPFDPTPTNPQITKFNVANKTDADGKLSVDIEVKVAE